MTYPAIEAKGLSRTYGDFTAVDGIDLTVDRGELFALLGPNGAGKTTTIKMLCSLLRLTSGTARVMGHDVATDPLSVKDVIDISPQETAIAEHLNARENLALIAGLHNVDAIEAVARTEALLEMMGLSNRAGERVKRYSGGMKRRLSIAMALVSNPKVLFLDEPTLGLDPQSRRAIWGHIESLKGHKTILLTTHYLEEADSLADRIAIIDEGNVVAMGTAPELKDGISDGDVMTIEAPGVPEGALEDLRALYPEVRRVAGGIEIRAEDIDLYDVQDLLRSRNVQVRSSHRKQVTLDDVFLHYTGKQLRE